MLSVHPVSFLSYLLFIFQGIMNKDFAIIFVVNIIFMYSVTI